MLTLPSLAPQDSYTLWYSSRTGPSPHATDEHETQPSTKPSQSRRNRAAAYRSPLVQLRLEEESIQHRKQNIIDYGAAWLRPPGVPKSLHQLREDERELREYQDALRREQQAQELAEAEARAATAQPELLPHEGLLSDMDEMQDLDDEIPEADLIHASSDAATDDEAETEDLGSNYETSTFAAHRHGHAPTADDLVYDRLLHENHGILDEEQMSGMLLEEDLTHEFANADRNDSTTPRDQDMDLDDDIPEAEEYEHTDTEEELCSSSEIDDEIESFIGS